MRRTCGHPEITAAALANIETGRPGVDGARRRDVTVDELAVFALALGIAEPWLLATVPDCTACQGAPPDGFTCNACGTGADIAELRVEQGARNRRRIVTPVLLEEVAEVYRAAYSAGNPPTVAVQEHFNTSHRNAARWVAEARKAGTLGPADSTRPGESGRERITLAPTG